MPSEVTTMSSDRNNSGTTIPKSKDCESTVVVKSYRDVLTTPNPSTDESVPHAKNQKCDGVTNEYVHVLYGHVHLRKAKSMAGYYGLRMCTTGTWRKKVLACESCALGKALKIGVNIHGTSTHLTATQPNEFVYLDLSTIRDVGGIPVRHVVWVASVDEHSGMATSLFVSTKGAMVESVCELLGDWKSMSNKVITIRCDNAG